MRTASHLFCSMLVSLVAAGALADDLRPVTHEDVWLMQRVGTPVVSPDGTNAVVSIEEPSYEEDASVRDLWLIDITGRNEPLRLTSSPEGESGVDWSPDGSRIAYSVAKGEDEPA